MIVNRQKETSHDKQEQIETIKNQKLRQGRSLVWEIALKQEEIK